MLHRFLYHVTVCHNHVAMFGVFRHAIEVICNILVCTGLKQTRWPGWDIDIHSKPCLKTKPKSCSTWKAWMVHSKKRYFPNFRIAKKKLRCKLAGFVSREGIYICIYIYQFDSEHILVIFVDFFAICSRGLAQGFCLQTSLNVGWIHVHHPPGASLLQKVISDEDVIS